MKKTSLKDFNTQVLLIAEMGLSKEQFNAFRYRVLDIFRDAQKKEREDEAAAMKWFRDKVLKEGKISFPGERNADFADAVMEEYREAGGEE